jgi:Hint domain
METPRASTAVRRTRRNVIAMGKLLGLGALGVALTARGAGAATGKPCFLRGTRIRTVDGDKKIEDIRIGDLVVTRSGATKPVRWVARRRYRRSAGARWVETIQPVRIARGALGPNVPRGDLFMSDTHALHFNGHLIQALDLMNDTTIARHSADELDEIEYFHVRLDAHDVIFAEGAECESLGDGNYERFDNFVEYERMYGKKEASGAGAYAPMLGCLGPRAALLSRLRSAVSPVIDRRTKLERLRDDLQERADALADGESVS